MNNKRFFSILGLIALTSILCLPSCSKEYEKMEVIKDCTGSYLRSKSGLDFYVCNYAILDGIPTGDKIKVKYDVLDECFGLIFTPTCTQSHTFEDVIDVIEIK